MTVSMFVGRSRLVGLPGNDFAATVEALGYSGLWVADVDPKLDVVAEALQQTSTLPIGSAVLSIWLAKAREVAASFAALDAAHPGRATLGLGVSHGPLVERLGVTYEKPYTRMAEYLDEVAATSQVPPARMVVGANGPRMLDLAAERTAGAVPYLVTPEQTAAARDRLGPVARLVPVQKVALDQDRAAARDLARQELSTYLGLPNYTRNLLRSGQVTEADLADGGSDQLVDLVVACGGQEAIRARVDQHLDAGADEVAVHVLAPRGELPTDDVARLAPALAA